MSKETFLQRTSNKKISNGKTQEKFGATIGFVDNIKYDAPADCFIRKSTTIILREKVPQDFKTVTQWVWHMYFCLSPNDSHNPEDGVVVLGADPKIYGRSQLECAPFVEAAYNTFNDKIPEEYQAESLKHWKNMFGIG
eukprot:11582046-Ditylum_brightwellii.AAC.1